MLFSLKAPDGTVIESYLKDDMEYEMLSQVDEFDSDAEIRQMIGDSERDIKLGKIYSTDEMIENEKA